MLLYTGQRNVAIKTMLENGQIYYCTWCAEVENDTEASFKCGYQWMMNTMVSHGVSKPELAKYPIWLTPEIEFAKDYNSNVLAFDIPDSEVLLSDEGLFGLFAYDAGPDIEQCLHLEDDSFIQATTWCLKPEWFKGIV